MPKVTWHNSASHSLTIRMVSDAGAPYVVEVPVGGTVDIDDAYTARIKNISPHLSRTAVSATAPKKVAKKSKTKTKTVASVTDTEATATDGDNGN